MSTDIILLKRLSKIISYSPQGIELHNIFTFKNRGNTFQIHSQ